MTKDSQNPSDPPGSDDETDLASKVDASDENVLREFLKYELRKDARLADRFATFVSDDHQSQQEYAAAVREKLDAVSEADGTITGEADFEPVLDRARVHRERGDYEQAMRVYRAVADTLAREAHRTEGGEVVGSSETYWHYESFVYTALSGYEDCLNQRCLTTIDRGELITDLVAVIPELTGYYTRYYRLLKHLPDDESEWRYLWQRLRDHDAYPDTALSFILDVFEHIDAESEDRRFVLDGIVTQCVTSQWSPSNLDAYEDICQVAADYQYFWDGLCEAADIPATIETDVATSEFTISNESLRSAVLTVAKQEGYDEVRLQVLRANAETASQGRGSPQMLQTLLEELVAAGEYAEAISTFERLHEMTAPGDCLTQVSTDARTAVLDAYQALDPEQYRFLLSGLLFDERDVTYYEQLVAASPRSREFIRTAFLEACKRDREESVMEGLGRPVTYYSLGTRGVPIMEVEILLNDGLTDRAMKQLEEYVSLEAVTEYHDAFASEFPERYYDAYKDAIEQKAQSTGRETYQTIARECLRLCELSGGTRDDVQAFVNRLLGTYDNRPAFHDEMQYFEENAPAPACNITRQT